MKLSKFQADLVERVAWTFAQAFLAVVIPALGGALPGSWSDWQKLLVPAAVAGGAAVLALMKGLIAKKVGDPSTAAIPSAVPEANAPVPAPSAGNS